MSDLVEHGLLDSTILLFVPRGNLSRTHKLPHTDIYYDKTTHAPKQTYQSLALYSFAEFRRFTEMSPYTYAGIVFFCLFSGTLQRCPHVSSSYWDCSTWEGSEIIILACLMTVSSKVCCNDGHFSFRAVRNSLLSPDLFLTDRLPNHTDKPYQITLSTHA